MPGRTGFDVTLVATDAGRWVDPRSAFTALRPDTLLVSVMAVNNETGVIQPIDGDRRARLNGHDAYFHVDGAQAYGKVIEPLRESAHRPD